jgi:hypothetical protein
MPWHYTEMSYGKNMGVSFCSNISDTVIPCNTIFAIGYDECHPHPTPTSGVPIAEEGIIYRVLTRAMVHPNQGIRHCAVGCMALGW